MNEKISTINPEAQKLIDLLNSEPQIPHPPYNNLMEGDLIPEQITPYHVNHTARNYKGGFVLYGDTDFARETCFVNMIPFLPTQLPTELELEPYIKYPERCAVPIAEMRNGTGDIVEALSCALNLTRAGINTSLVLPRDQISYNKALKNIEQIKPLANNLRFDILQYHECFERPPFDLAVYPSTQRYSGSVPSKTSILLRESGESMPRSCFAWNSIPWGGVTIGINTGFDSTIDKYGANGPLFEASELDSYLPNAYEKEILSQISLAKTNGKEVVLAYPGSNQESDQGKFLDLYAKLINNQKDSRNYLAIVPGISSESALIKGNVEFLFVEHMNNSFLNLLMKDHISKSAPSFVAGSMSLVEAMYHGIPFFYKSELWKEGNTGVLENLLTQYGLNPVKTEGDVSRGILNRYGEERGSSIKILSYSQIMDIEKQKMLSKYLSSLVISNKKKLTRSILGWFGLLSKISNQSPENISKYLNSIERNKQMLISNLLQSD